MATVLGAHSPKLATVRALRAKKGRREQKRFVVEGPTMLREALEAGWVPAALFATEAAYAELAGRDGLPVAQVYLITERSLAQLSDVESPAGVVTVFAHRFDPLDRLFAGNQPIALLAGVADPGNAGTLLRSAEAFGLAGAIFGNDGVEPYNPKVVRASMGALFRLRLAVADLEFHAHLGERRLQRRGRRLQLCPGVVGMDGNPQPGRANRAHPPTLGHCDRERAARSGSLADAPGPRGCDPAARCVRQPQCRGRGQHHLLRRHAALRRCSFARAITRRSLICQDLAGNMRCAILRVFSGGFEAVTVHKAKKGAR